MNVWQTMRVFFFFIIVLCYPLSHLKAEAGTAYTQGYSTTPDTTTTTSGSANTDPNTTTGGGTTTGLTTTTANVSTAGQPALNNLSSMPTGMQQCVQTSLQAQMNYVQQAITTSAGVYQNTPFSNKIPCIKAMLTFFSVITTIAGLGKAVVMILESIVVAVLNYACQLVVSMINSVLAQLCIPLPSIPGFGLGSNGTKSCSGIQLISPLSVAPITTQAVFGDVNTKINASIDSYTNQANTAVNNLVNSTASAVSGLISSTNANTGAAPIQQQTTPGTTTPTTGTAPIIPVQQQPLPPAKP